MKETLLAFIESVQKDAENIRQKIVIQCGGDVYPELWFGYGYFDRGKVLFWASPADQEEIPNEEAVDRFLSALNS